MTKMIEEENTEGEDFATAEKQEARAFLRERFLRMMCGMTGKKATLDLCDGSTVAGIFFGSDHHVTTLHIKELKTPFGIIPNVHVRTTDLIQMHVEDVS